MTVVDGIHALAKWLEDEVCSSIKLKAQSSERQTNDYDYRLVNPSVFEMYVPPSRMAKDVNKSVSPSVLIHLLDGQDFPRKQSRDLKFRLLLSVWNPGAHPNELPVDENGKPALFQQNADGWNDLWNFTDALVSKIEKAEQIGGILRVKEEDGIVYRPYAEDGVLVDFYPFYFAEIEFSCAMAQAPSPTYVGDYL